jgi:hypothetical protein
MRTRFRPTDSDRQAHIAAVERHVIMIALALMTLLGGTAMVIAG